MVYSKESDFEEAFIQVLKQHGWDDAGGVLRYPTQEQLIQNWADILLANNSDIDRLNGCPLTDTEMQQIIDQIETLKTPYALNGFINGRTISIKRDNPDDTLHLGKEVSLKIYDRREIAGGKSRYQIAQQPVYPAKNRILNDRRGDICLLINGMPVIHLELKRSGIPVSQACHQLEKYTHEGVFSGIFRLVQLFVAINPDDAVYFANPGQAAFNPTFFFRWADFNNEPICGGEKPGQDRWKVFVAKVLSIPMAHKMIGFYTVADSGDGKLKVLRSYQLYASNAISDRVCRCRWDLPPDEGVAGRPGGYVWHTTGSGKTLTSFKSAQLIADSKDADKVLFLMDRIELGTQSLKEYQGFADDADSVQATENTDVLRSKLLSTDPRDTLIVTSIQKMSRIRVDNGVSADELARMASKRVVFILDECHRSTFGSMLYDIRRSFPNALFFGFTGTPIQEENSKKDATTSMVFGPCLHRYSIADGIRDKNVLGFDPYMVSTFRDTDLRKAVGLYEARAGTMEEAHANPQKLKVLYYFLLQASMAGHVDTRTGEYIKGIEDYVPASQYGPESPHPAMVVDDIVRQFGVLSQGGRFHAIFATSSIAEAANYYRLLRAAAPDLAVSALFDPNIDNTAGAIFKEDALVEIISDYNQRYGKAFSIATWPLMKKDMAARLAHKQPHTGVDMHREERLDILIVVDQMLTGFDSKWVNTLYLDKVIAYENVIQAFSRTNRTFGPEKPFGTIRYYRKPHTMRKNIAAAVRLYSGDTPLDLFVQKLPGHIRAMNACLQGIILLFRAYDVEDLSCLPAPREACAKFAADFICLGRLLECAKVQGFSLEQRSYTFRHPDGSSETVDSELDRRTWQILLLRYRELFDPGTGDVPGTGLPADIGASVPYELDSHLSEMDTGLIDTEYMNANFIKWLKALHEDSEAVAVASAELHRSFASLSRDEQRLAELLLHDVERGDLVPREGVSLRDYITRYARREKEGQIDSLVQALGVDRSVLTELMGLDLNEGNLNEFGRFDRLKATVDKVQAKAYFERMEGAALPLYRVNMKAAELLRRFLFEGGIDIAG